MIDLLVIAILVAVIGGAIAYIVYQKKHGAHCIGCPDSKSCSHSNQTKSDGCGGNCSGCGGNCHH
ncbi:MAG: FeoB-associated Cys-rich membrane protein [Eubacteriales bacterium]